MDAKFYFLEAAIADVFVSLASPFSKSALKNEREKKLKKFNKQISKHPQFYADFTAVEKVAKSSCRKSAVLLNRSESSS
jgi:hypothetical protein